MNAIIFENLRAEMARQNITISKMAYELDMRRETLSRKLSGSSPIMLNEAFLIQKRFFPNNDVKLLFKELAQDKAS